MYNCELHYEIITQIAAMTTPEVTTPKQTTIKGKSNFSVLLPVGKGGPHLKTVTMTL